MLLMQLQKKRILHQKMKFLIKDFFSKRDQIRRKLKTFTEKILNGKLYFFLQQERKKEVNKNNVNKKSFIGKVKSGKQARIIKL